jgi:hypothetical protein
MITLTSEEAQQVLDALEAHADIGIRADKAIETLRARLAQPEREWHGLTDEEKVEIQALKWWDWEDTFDLDGYTRAIEAKLKEKNK